ncbi:MAG: DUF2079 domain-containing protein, partial [Candidatus Dormibacteraeota bacterium]|nr:DUF2079 domain-containing protein [Candidatus Dormibacteraeota bacterium]
FDLGTQDQTVWGYSQLQMIPNTVLGIRNLLGDHFHPILMILAPLYRIWPSPIVLLVTQGVLVALGGLPVYLWGAERLGRTAGLLFQASYLVFWGVLAGILFDFHHVAFAVPAISVALYGALTRRNGLLLLGVVVGLLTREDVSLTLVGLGVYLALFQRRIWLGGGLMALGLAWFATVVGVVIPAIAGDGYGHWLYDELGSGPLSAAVHVVLHPVSSLQLLFTPFHKVEVWIGLLGSWLFLPLFSPLLVVAIPSLLERFWSTDATLWSFRYQYSLIEAPILAFAAIDAVARIRRLLGPRLPAPRRLGKFGAVSLAGGSLAVSLVLSIGVVQPLSELNTYVSSARAAQIQSCLDVIPPGAGVGATGHLLPHLSDRRSIYLIPWGPSGDPAALDSEYVAVDPTVELPDDPHYDQYLRVLITSSLDRGYGVACSKGLTAVLERDHPGQGSLSPQLKKWLAQ